MTAKLVRSTDLERADRSLAQCEVRSCSARDLVWLVLVEGNLGQTDGGPATPSEPKKWMLFALRADGSPRGDSFDGSGTPPTYFGQLPDLAPD
ncbi:MAG: hypothetical protein JOZ37_15100 [Actinobacteria bacterium]|nr:hypothetical protein [Actinomycetota bacterium]MBV9935031.1 hypothetical protein [Actinomycetota bacterium]